MDLNYVIKELSKIIVTLNDRKNFYLEIPSQTNFDKPENYVLGQIEGYEQGIDLMENLLTKLNVKSIGDK